MTVKAKVLLGAAVFAVALCGFGSWGLSTVFRSTTAYLEASAVEEGDAILATLGKTWSLEDLKASASADFLVMVNTDEEKKAWLSAMRASLGAYKEGGGRLDGGVRVVKDLAGEDAFGAVYLSEPTFEKRKAKVTLQLIQRQAGGGWQMASMGVEGVKPPETPGR